MERLDILLVEDDAYDAKLVESAVRRAGIDASWRRVDNESDFLTAIQLPHDVLITDFKLPSFNALRVLEILEAQGLELPTLVVTGAIDDELAADCIKRGAADYLLKDRMARIGDAIIGAIARTSARREKRQAQEQLLAEARARIMLYSMQSRSLARTAVGAAVPPGDVLAPLLQEGSLPGLVGIRYERDGKVLSEDWIAGPAPEATEFGRALEGPAGGLGRLSFYFAAGAPPDLDLMRFLDQAAAVFAGYLVRGDSERDLIRSIAEKDELLREIHHRVKNNLAAVAGLISLEAGRTGDQGVRSVLVELEGRINSMALVHEMLYERGGFTGIDLEGYARELAIRVAQSVGVDTERFRPTIECPDLQVALETAVTLGIMVSELFARSAIRTMSDTPPTVRLQAARLKDKAGMWRMEYSEEGGSAIAASASALDLVGLIVGQFGGSIRDSAGELRVVIDLPAAGSADLP